MNVLYLYCVLFQVYLSYQFYRAPDSKNSRKLFFFSLLYLPLIMLLMVVSNVGRNDEQKKTLAEKADGIKKFVGGLTALTSGTVTPTVTSS